MIRASQKSYGRGLAIKHEWTLLMNQAKLRQRKHKISSARIKLLISNYLMLLLYILVNTKVGVEFEMLEVKVPLIFLGTQGFSARRDGR